MDMDRAFDRDVTILSSMATEFVDYPAGDECESVRRQHCALSGSPDRHLSPLSEPSCAARHPDTPQLAPGSYTTTDTAFDRFMFRLPGIIGMRIFALGGPGIEMVAEQ